MPPSAAAAPQQIALRTGPAPRQLEKFAELERHVDAERQGLRERSEEGELEEFT
ncbi:YscO family type III secretion system apparatus protein, partial [Pseudomonas aeruginosa]|nr:YscO family type III secretion system apparatus protein [Pseudomonas aeruginosa]